MTKPWGHLLAIDLHGCPKDLMKDKEHLRAFSKLLCREINMVPYGETLVERFGEGDLEGLSSMQFIQTSTITVHLDEVDDRAFIDVFSCKNFDIEKTLAFAKDYFKATDATYNYHDRA